jgi:hypothetical protein
LLTINSGEEYRACIATVKDLELICKTGNNSPATRPEFVDLSLNATGGGVQQAAVADEEGAATVEEEEEDTSGDEQEDTSDDTDETELEDEVGEGEDISPGIPPAG